MWVECVGSGGGEALRRKECCGVRLDGVAVDGETNCEFRARLLSTVN